ncbi:MAG: hypothetical protein B6A08_15630 [Sorangiineae bacterium NIC37A_2]|jgi:hypothetical protein|nr:MAG: hypothetical protein B6A08_15630 [Sorangiineae bacterium NIC37A_2]
MRRRKVRCYRAFAEGAGTFNNEVFYIATEGYRIELASCTCCGEVFAVDRENRNIGARALREVSASVACPGCGTVLRDSISAYPEVFLARNGKLGCFSPPTIIPPDEESAVMEFWALEIEDFV